MNEGDAKELVAKQWHVNADLLVASTSKYGWFITVTENDSTIGGSVALVDKDRKTVAIFPPLPPKIIEQQYGAERNKPEY